MFSKNVWLVALLNLTSESMGCLGKRWSEALLFTPKYREKVKVANGQMDKGFVQSKKVTCKRKLESCNHIK